MEEEVEVIKIQRSHAKVVTTALFVLAFTAVCCTFALAQDDDCFVGLVQSGKFLKLTPCDVMRQEVRLTGISMQTAMAPEARELDLSEYEAQVIVVCGHDSGGWIYSARVEEVATPAIADFILQCCHPNGCRACLEKINSATRADFEKINGIGPVLSERLVAGQPYKVPICFGPLAIELVLDEVPGIGEILRERIVRHFCPELYDEEAD